mmetsp:Transcript_15252/g.57964  ORF Transcript_15252/g.57964 Transcript_15252/m.57964 type:complete len:426 (+) Transcript_15252:4081-5358(+)
MAQPRRVPGVPGPHHRHDQAVLPHRRGGGRPRAQRHVPHGAVQDVHPRADEAIGGAPHRHDVRVRLPWALRDRHPEGMGQSHRRHAAGRTHRGGYAGGGVLRDGARDGCRRQAEPLGSSRGHERHRHGRMALHHEDPRVPGGPRDRDHCQRRHLPVRILRRQGRRLLLRGQQLRSGARHSPHLPQLEQRGAHRASRGAQADAQRRVEGPGQPGAGLRLPVLDAGGLRQLEARNRRGARGVLQWSDGDGPGRRHRHGAWNRRREPARIRHDRRRDLARLRRNLHALLRLWTLGRHRRLPRPPGTAHDPDEERPDAPHRLQRPQQASRSRSVHQPGSAWRTASDVPQWCHAPAGRRRQGRHRQDRPLAVVRAEGHQLPAASHANVGPRRPRGRVGATSAAVRPAQLPDGQRRCRRLLSRWLLRQELV